MAYFFTAGTSITALAAPGTGSPMTIVGWLKPDTTASGTFRQIFRVQNTIDGDFHSNYLAWDSTNGTQNRLLAVAVGTTYTQATSGTFTSGTWIHAAAVFTSATSRRTYLNGIAGTENTTNCGTQNVANRCAIGINTIGDIAEVGVWDVALTAAEVLSLSKGMRCDSIRPQSLLFYAPLVRDIVDIKNGLELTNNSATVSDHPRIYG